MAFRLWSCSLLTDMTVLFYLFVPQIPLLLYHSIIIFLLYHSLSTEQKPDKTLIVPFIVYIFHHFIHWLTCMQGAYG